MYITFVHCPKNWLRKLSFVRMLCIYSSKYCKGVTTNLLMASKANKWIATPGHFQPQPNLKTICNYETWLPNHAKRFRPTDQLSKTTWCQAKYHTTLAAFTFQKEGYLTLNFVCQVYARHLYTLYIKMKAKVIPNHLN